MSFYETKMGRTFFEHHVPQLIQAVQDVAAALSKPAQMAPLPAEPDPDFLSELYHGGYEPETVRQTPESSELAQAVNEAHDELLAVLPEEEHKRLIKYQDAMAERNSAEMLRAYESGYRTAVQMMVAGLSQPADRQMDNAA